MLAGVLAAGKAKVKKTHCGYCGALLETDGTCATCPKPRPRKPAQPERVKREGCEWPECKAEANLRIWSAKEWLALCFEHYGKHYQQHGIATAKPQGQGYRERWYAQQQKPYQPAPTRSSEHLKHWTAMHGKLPREPGSDDE